jgi:hypothetical protein
VACGGDGAWIGKNGSQYRPNWIPFIQLVFPERISCFHFNLRACRHEKKKSSGILPPSQVFVESFGGAKG